MIPKFLSHLPVYGEYPVPFVQMYIDGKPDFRVIDPDRVQQCINETLCAICGRKLGEYSCFIGGDKCKVVHQFADWAMHDACAEFASHTCPFVSGKREEYSKREIDKTRVATLDVVDTQRPTQMFIFKTRTKTIRVIDTPQGCLFGVGPWAKVTEIHAGKVK